MLCDLSGETSFLQWMNDSSAHHLPFHLKIRRKVERVAHRLTRGAESHRSILKREAPRVHAKHVSRTLSAV
ncbi:MAG: hypothetical protein NZM11_12650, partial [Anaerolineales bacterium]|nr:hypothetical protein [Anaerolineales bacterium]